MPGLPSGEGKPAAAGESLTVLVPYVAGMLHPATRRLLRLHVPSGTLIDWREIDRADNEAYWRLLAESWRQPGSTLIVEHDIGIRAGVIEELADCPEPYCGFPYPLDRGVMLACLGCTRFRSCLKAAEPDLLGVVGEVAGDGLPARDWRRLDVRTGDELKRRGYAMHVHQPPVRHYHKYA